MKTWKGSCYTNPLQVKQVLFLLAPCYKPPAGLEAERMGSDKDFKCKEKRDGSYCMLQIFMIQETIVARQCLSFQRKKKGQAICQFLNHMIKNRSMGPELIGELRSHYTI